CFLCKNNLKKMQGSRKNSSLIVIKLTVFSLNFALHYIIIKTNAVTERSEKGEKPMTSNQSVLAWIEEMKKLVNPDHMVWIDGSEEQLEELRAQACATGEMIKLNQEKLPGCYLHRTAVNDVARVEDRTFICSRK